MRAMSKMSARIIDQNDKLEVYYSTPFCFCICFVLLQQKPVKPELYGVIRWHIVRDLLISYTAKQHNSGIIKYIQRTQVHVNEFVLPYLGIKLDASRQKLLNTAALDMASKFLNPVN